MESDQPRQDLILSVAYNDLSDVWNIFGQALEEGVSHLQQVAIKSKVGAVSRVKNIPVKVVSSTSDKSLSRLLQYRKSPMSWFRLPFVELVCFSCDDYDEYKRNFRLQLRAMADTESRLPTDPIPIFVYVQPVHLDDSKGPSRVVDAASKELGDRNFPGNTVVHVAKNMFGIQDLVESIRAALFVSVEARCSAYHHEASAILSRSLESPLTDDTSLSELYLVKDSAAALYEAVGMHQDAWIEYGELEVMIEERFSQISSLANSSDDDDCKSIQISQNDPMFSEASQMWQRWHSHRSLVSRISSCLKATIHEGRAFIDLVLAPCIVSNMVRLLMKDLKRMETLDTCQKFIEKHRLILQQYERNQQCPRLLPETWIFAACIGSVLLTCSHDGELKSGDLYFSKVLEDMEIGRHDNTDLLHVAQNTLQGLDKPGKSRAFYCKAGQLLMVARDMLEGLGKSYHHAPPEFQPSPKDLIDLLKKGSLKAAPMTPNNVMSSRHRLTPQNSLGPDDSPRFGVLQSHSNELVRLAHENTLAMDNIDLSNVDNERASSPESADKDLAPRNISLHAREISDSGTIADVVLSNTMTSQGSQTDGSSQISAENLSFLQTEASINMDEEGCLDMCMHISLVESINATQVTWLPQYWRLHHGLKSGLSFEKIWKTVTTSCRDLFAKGGYQRNACILNIELGNAAYIGKDFSNAVKIYETALVSFEDNHWKELLQSVALKLACSQIQSNNLGIIGTCNLLLQLACDKSKTTAPDIVKTFAEIFIIATRLSGAALSSANLAETESLVLNPSLVLDVDKSIGMVIYEMDGMLSYAGDYQSCINAHVGDSVSLKIEIINDSKMRMTLEKPSICLVTLQEMSNIEHSLGLANATPMPMTPIVPSNNLHSPTFSPRSPNDEGWKPRIISHWQDIDEVQGICTTNGPVDIQPGRNVLEFCVNPIRSGLYKLKHVQSSINGVNVQILPIFDAHGCAGQHILLSVEPPAPRMFVNAITTGKQSLISGEDQWLGLEVNVSREAVSQAQLIVEWPSRNDGSSIDKAKSEAMEAGQIIKPLHPHAIVKSLLAEYETIFASPETNGDIIGSGPSSMYSLSLENGSNLHAAVWWRVNVKHIDPMVEDVRVYSYQRSRMRNASPSKGQTGLPLRQTKQALTVMEMPVSLHYSDHCSRAASSSAKVSIDQPFQIQTDAFEIRKGVVLLSLKITSSIERQVLVTRAALDCQKGFKLEREHAEASDILPCTLEPLSSLCISFTLELEEDLLENRAVAQAMVYRTGKLVPSVASIEYSVENNIDEGSVIETYIMDDHHNSESSSALYSVYDRSFGPTQDDYKHLQSRGLREAPSTYLYQHKIALQLSSIDTDAYNVFVCIRMLGPFTANIGCPTTLCWQLERVGSGSHSTGFSTISYEILADKNCWSKGSRGQGRILLGLQNGSIATIEAEWTPTSLGTLEVPTLQLHDVYYQEVRETGVKKNLILVKS